MFRDLYKQANDEIKGNREILDKAFLKAAQPVKTKSPIMKYSFVGTAVAAVFILGAVFANSSLFTQKVEDMPKEVVTETENIPVAVSAENAPVADEEKFDGAENAVPKVINEVNEADEAQYDDIDDAAMILSVEEETEAEGIMFKMPRKGGGAGGDSEIATEVLDKEEAVNVFSYMYDVSTYNGITEGFVNNTESPITNRDEAIARAKNECTVEYDSINVYYDPVEMMWKVSFFTENILGGNEDIYLTSSGITVFIVYGE